MKTNHKGVAGDWTEHTCEPMKVADWEQHGHAVTSVFSHADYPGVWWAGNGEYATAVSFCPFCGVNLEAEPLT